MVKARQTYIHSNKNTITIGIKGQKKITFQTKKLLEGSRKAFDTSRQLANIYSKNANFPDVAKQIFEKEVSVLQDILLKQTDGLNVRETLKDLKKLNDIATKPRAFSKYFYSEIKKYYGVKNMNTNTLKKHLRQGDFLISQEDYEEAIKSNGHGTRKKPSDPARLQDWIVDNIPDVDEEKVRNIDNVYQLQKIVQDFVVMGVVPEEIQEQIDY